MSQYYGQQPPVGQPPAAQPWSPGPLGMPPGYRPPKKSNTPRLIAIAGGAFAVLLIAGGAVLLLMRGSGDAEAAPQPQNTDPTAQQPTDLPTDQPTASESAGPTPTRTYVRKPGEVEVGRGVYVMPYPGWRRDTTYKNNGASYTLPRPGGSIQGWFWARQTELYDAKGFAEHLADIESNNLQHVTIARGRYIPCRRPNIVKCYAINFSAVVPASQTKARKPIVFRGLIQAFQNTDGVVTASDAALRNEVFHAYYPQIQKMIVSMWDSM